MNNVCKQMFFWKENDRVSPNFIYLSDRIYIKKH